MSVQQKVSSASYKQVNDELALIDQATCDCIVALKNLLPDHTWSETFKTVCLDIQDGGNVAFYDQVEAVARECLAVLNHQNNDQFCGMQDQLKAYTSLLTTGRAHVGLADILDEPEQVTRSCCKVKTKKICRLCVRCLTVTGRLTVNGTLSVNGTFLVNGIDFSSPEAIADALAASPASIEIITDAIAADAAAVATLAAALAGTGGLGGYGYIYTLTQAATVAIEAPILFDSNGPLLGVTHTPGSSAIGIVNAGTYAITFSVSGTEPNQFAIFVNGVPDASTIYGSGAGTQQNTGHAILTLGAGDVITIVNHSSAAAGTLAPLVGGTQVNVRASVLISRLA